MASVRLAIDGSLYVQIGRQLSRLTDLAAGLAGAAPVQPPGVLLATPVRALPCQY